MGKGRRRYNRHGFQNFGGRHSGQAKYPITDTDMLTLKWIKDSIDLHVGGEVTTKMFDGHFQPIGSVIRHEMRRQGLITEELIPPNVDCKTIRLTRRAELMLAAPKRTEI